MDGFKNTTKMKYMGAGGMVDGYSMGGYAKGGNAKPMMKGGDAKPMMAKGGNAKAGAKISKVMGEFKKGDLHSGSKDGPKVKSPKQAMAIALSAPLGESVKSGNRVSKMTAAEMREMEERFGNKRRPSPGDSVKSGNRIAKEEADEARHLGVFKKGGKVRKYAEGGPVEPAMKRSMPAFDTSAAYQGLGYELKNMIDSGQLTLEQANAIKAPAFEATRLRDAGQQQQAMQAALAIARGQMAPVGVGYGPSEPPTNPFYAELGRGLGNLGPKRPPVDPGFVIGPRDPNMPSVMPPTMVEQPRAGMLGGLLGALNNPRMKQALQQKMMQPQAPRRGLLGALNNPRIREDLQQAMMQPPPAGMAPVEPRNVTMMRHGGRAAMPKRGR